LLERGATLRHEHPELHDEVVHGASDNYCAARHNASAIGHGYRPRQRAGDHAAALPEAATRRMADPASDLLPGSCVWGDGFGGDPGRPPPEPIPAAGAGGGEG